MKLLVIPLHVSTMKRSVVCLPVRYRKTLSLFYRKDVRHSVIRLPVGYREALDHRSTCETS
jgi:hypothetical protein